MEFTVNVLSRLRSLLIINEESLLKLTQELEFLDFLLNSAPLPPNLIRDELRGIKRDCQSHIRQRTIRQCSVSSNGKALVNVAIDPIEIAIAIEIN